MPVTTQLGTPQAHSLRCQLTGVGSLGAQTTRSPRPPLPKLPPAAKPVHSQSGKLYPTALVSLAGVCLFCSVSLSKSLFPSASPNQPPVECGYRALLHRLPGDTHAGHSELQTVRASFPSHTGPSACQGARPHLQEALPTVQISTLRLGSSVISGQPGRKPT